ncbi:MAG TPA: branched-chain amino acid aminotransferase [Syntrophomonadaceae bacterium]|nr:branched-chain amino acid aminotransferase [Syntrophomonadaceae bacterium]
MANEILVQKNPNPKPKPDWNNLGFGNYYTDHMFILDYTEGKGWHDPRVVPYGPLEMDPATMVLHYAQAAFEGLKAYKTADGRVLIFRPYDNARRMNNSNERLCMPALDPEMFVQAIKTLVTVDKDWIPDAEGTSLYIRPFIFATDVHLGVHPSHTYKFMIVLSPVGAYYPEGINPVKIYVEKQYVRAVKGGLGFTKAAANYAASLKAQEEANQKGYTQVLWLDGIEKKYIDEVGTMNVFFKINNELITPALEDGSLLPGITRDSTMRLVKEWGIKVNERRLTIEEVYAAHAAGTLEEAFGTGTAAVISPVGVLNWDEKLITINDGKTGELATRIYDTLTGIQWGKLPDLFGWTVEV